MRRFIVTTLALAMFIGSFGSVTAQRGSHGGGPQVAVEIDNDAVQVLRMRMDPHERTGMHDVSARVVVWLTDANIRDTHADGTVTEEHFKAGEVTWVPAQRHLGENMDNRALEFIAIVSKAGARASLTRPAARGK